MSVSEQTRTILDDALRLAWQAVKDETLVEEYLLVQESIPKGLILADKQAQWKNLVVKKFAIMNELSERFKNA